MMTDLDGLLLYLGIVFTVGSLGAILRPGLLVKESLRNRNARLRELDAGAPEAYFEERRELESYPPRFDLSHDTLRRFGIAGLVLGVVCIIWGLAA